MSADNSEAIRSKFKARADAVLLRWNVNKALAAGTVYVEGYEVHGTAAGGDIVLHWGFGQGGGMVRVTLVDLTGASSLVVNGTAAQVKAAIRLFIEGDVGNEYLYPLAEAVQPTDKSFRFIP